MGRGQVNAGGGVGIRNQPGLVLGLQPQGRWKEHHARVVLLPAPEYKKLIVL